MKENCRAMVLQFFLLLLIMLPAMAVASTSEALPHCPEKCGNVSIPYPFGIGEGCYYMDSTRYKVICNDHNYSFPKPFTGALEILNISLIDAQMVVDGRYAADCYNSRGEKLFDIDMTDTWIDLRGSPFTFSFTRNKFVSIGCDTFAVFSESQDKNFLSGCMSACNNNTSVVEGSCSGIGCCQTSIPQGLRRFNISVGSLSNHTKTWNYNPCSYAFLADDSWFNFKLSDLSTFDSFKGTQIPLVLDWAIGKETCEEAQRGHPASYACGRPNSYCADSTNGPGYRCYCNKGYQGNPYLPQGCQDIDECADAYNNSCIRVELCHNMNGNYSCICPQGYHGDGKVNGSGCTADTKSFQMIRFVLGIGLGLLFLIVCSCLLYWTFKKRRLIKLREKFFQQNGGLLLQQQIATRKSVSDIAKIFTEEDLKRATNNYDESRVLGQGGYGTVYKGVLSDKRVVAIKKPKLMDKSQIIQFINEVEILSQINHRNVVKLLGCCLETEVPLLVYEFVPNGTLSQHIHNETHATSISWENRLRIASETTEALSYLHSAHSIPVLHRDVKSANILLDDNYTTKVSDFGASRLVPLDQTQMTTLVQGTLGYLDPECFHTGQLTEKSDVYSFGVVLAELLTGEMPLSSDRSEQHRSLVMYFISSIKENRLFQILEDRVVNEGDREQILAVAELTKRCLNVKGEERPTMKEVAIELDRLRRLQEHPWVQQNHEESKFLLGEPSDSSIGYATGQDSLGADFLLPLEIAR